MLDHGTYDMIPTVFRPMLLMVFSSSPGFVSEAARWVSMRGQACSMVTAAHPILFVDTKCVLTYSHTHNTHTHTYIYIYILQETQVKHSLPSHLYLGMDVSWMYNIFPWPFNGPMPMPGIPFAFRPFQATRATCAIGPAPWALCAGKGAAAALHREHGRHSTNREVLQTKQDKQLRLPVCSLHW